MEKLTIHRALSELKLIGSRIDKAIDEFAPSGILQKDKLVNGVYQKDEFEKKTPANYQSIIDLILRRDKIKSAIVQANALTEVSIAGEKMKIADAINLKSSIIFRKRLVENIQKKHQQTKAALERNNAAVDKNATELAAVALGKTSIKIGDDDVKKVIEPYLEVNRFSMIDPIGIDQKMKDMDKSVGDFEAEVDAVLSEINATTFIEL